MHNKIICECGNPECEFEQNLADELNLTLCDGCGEPREIHAGYNHGRSGSKPGCILDIDGWMIQLDGQLTKAQQVDLSINLARYYRRLADHAEAMLSIGEVI